MFRSFTSLAGRPNREARRACRGTRRRTARLGALALAAATAAGLVVSAPVPAEASLCPTVVPGYGCDSIWTSGLNGLDDWLADLLASSSNSGGEVVHVPSARSSRYSGCVESSYLPGVGVMQLIRSDGTQAFLQADKYRGYDTVHYQLGATYYGEYYTPFDGDDIYVRYENRIVNETTTAGTIR